MPTAEELIISKIKKIHPDADRFQIQEVGSPFIGGQAYYIEFHSPTVGADEAFFYAFVANGACSLYEDGLEVIKALEERLERRRSFWQRISDFDFTETVGAIIALMIALTFVIMLVIKVDPSKEFFALFSLIVGYYFGRNKPGP
jgi:hypothetical protein